jgi:hypothetical protein
VADKPLRTGETHLKEETRLLSRITTDHQRRLNQDRERDHQLRHHGIFKPVFSLPQ